MWIVAGHAVGRSLCRVCWGTPNGLSLQVMAAMVPQAAGGAGGPRECWEEKPGLVIALSLPLFCLHLLNMCTHVFSVQKKYWQRG